MSDEKAYLDPFRESWLAADALYRLAPRLDDDLIPEVEFRHMILAKIVRVEEGPLGLAARGLYDG